MPRDCAFCRTGVMSICVEVECSNYICPAHTTEDGKCKNTYGIAVHVSAESDIGVSEEIEEEANPPSSDDASSDEPSTNAPSEAPRRRRKKTEKSPSE